MLRALPRPIDKRRTELIAIPDCPVHAESVRRRVREIGSELRWGPEAFSLFAVFFNGEFTSLVLKQARLEPAARAELARLADAHGWNLWVHLNPSAGRRVMTARGWEAVGSRATAEARDEEGFAYGPTSFRQAIGELHRESLAEAAEFLRPDPASPVTDLYCGIGKSLALWRDRGAPALGVELSSAATRLAELNAPGAIALAVRVEDRVPQLEAWRAEQPSDQACLYLNPSRTGVEPEVLRWITEQARPARIAYLSCNPRTLSRDLGILRPAGYRLRRLTPYDFFPQTAHVETLALLDRGDLR
jgi:tRNA/tmRNA/rRNA uracil-C5-methylase (TrmA/RlmC/RlmD family)